MSERDELANRLADLSYRGRQMTSLEAKVYADVVLKWLSEQGYRRSVSSEDIEVAAMAQAELDGSDVFGVTGEQFKAARDEYRRRARLTFHAAGIEVVE